MSTFVSVVICAHNPRAEYLQRVLDGLRRQTLPLAHWELLLVDNASSPRIADHWDMSWHPGGRHVQEENLGLTAARLRGINETVGEVVVFVDDDNVLSADFLARALAIAEDRPDLAVFGAGRIEPEFETPPATELGPHLRLLALRTVATQACSRNPTESWCVPWGAGLCVTRLAAAAYVRLVEKLDITSVIGRPGSRRGSTEDSASFPT